MILWRISPGLALPLDVSRPGLDELSNATSRSPVRDCPLLRLAGVKHSCNMAEEGAAPAGNKFTFVTVTNAPRPDSQSRTLARRHVMRDIGKSRRKSKGKDKDRFSMERENQQVDRRGSADALFDSIEASPSGDGISGSSRGTSSQGSGSTNNRTSTNTGACSEERLPIDSPPPSFNSPIIPFEACDGSTSINWFGGGRHDPFAPYPIEMTMLSHELVEHSTSTCPCIAIPANYRAVFRHSLSAKLRVYRDVWYPVGIRDPAAFRQILSSYSFHLLSHQKPEDSRLTTEMLNNHLLALSSVRQRLIGPSAVIDPPDGIMSAVIAFACHAVRRRDFCILFSSSTNAFSESI